MPGAISFSQGGDPRRTGEAYLALVVFLGALAVLARRRRGVGWGGWGGWGGVGGVG